MQRELTSATTLDNLRREAKRWLKALRDPNPEARERFDIDRERNPELLALFVDANKRLKAKLGAPGNTIRGPGG